MTRDYVLGFDVGGTRIKSGAFDRAGKALWSDVVPSHAMDGPARLLKAIVAQVRAAERSLRAKPAAIGLGLSGGVDPELGVVHLPGKFKGLENFPLVPRLRKALDIPVLADNDGRLAMVAERRWGLARNVDWAVAVTLGTGVGSGVLLDGRILRDPHRLFGLQLGHFVLQNYGGRLCLTGAKGTGETLCSATSLAMSVRDGIQRGIPSVLSDEYWRNPHAIDFAAVMRGVARRDALCLEELDRWVQNVGWLLVSAVHAYSPQLIILSGGATGGARHFLAKLQRHVDQYTFRYPPKRSTPVRVSKLGDQAGVMGAAAMMWETLA